MDFHLAEEVRVPYDPTANLAGTGKRFANLIIDTIIVYLFFFFIIILYSFFLGVFYPEHFETMEEDSNNLLFITVFMVAHFFYYMVMESVFGRTVGKLITNTQVVDEDGDTPGTSVIFMRSLARLVPFNAFSFLSTPCRGWHDQWTDTYVVNKK